MASRRTKTIEEIDDLVEMSKVMVALGISGSGFKTLDEMKAKVKEELSPSVAKPSCTAGQTYEILSEAKKSDAKKRERLLELFIKTEKFMDQLDTDFTETLQKSLGDFKTTLKKNIDDIKPRDEYVVLVAGETSAGKSSLINLILGEDLLPYKLLSSTSTICELKYGEKPKIGVHFKQTGPETRQPMFQELVTDGRETYIQQIEKFASLESGREEVPYTKIELFFPHPLFKEGVTIVDSPGIGESDVMSEFVLNYLPRAFCFMYVINSYNAGGIQSDRLEKLLTCAQNLKENAKVDLALFTGCTLFVANKWDLIYREERELVKKEQIEKLSKKLPNLNPSSQIVHLSCETAQFAQTYGVITGDFDDLIAGISSLVVSSMISNLEKYCRKLEYLLAHVSRQIRIKLKSTEISHQETELREGDERLYQQLLEDKRSKTEIKEVYEPLQIQINLLQRSLTVYQLDEVRKSDFTDEELKCDEKWQSIIGDGSFSTVYRGVLHRKGHPEIDVALKRYRDPLTTNNVRHFVEEERALRELSHPNIVKFYGTNLQHGRNGTTVMIILELCSCSLRYHVMSHPAEAPARLPKEAVVKKVLGWALNIVDALRYIHCEGFVHRDLQLNNILLARNGRVKIADVGASMYENEITGAICGTSIYLAPEVFETRISNSKADMYSLGYVLWELWYGETAFKDAVDSRTKYKVLKDVVKHDLRPTHIEGTHPPWGNWPHVMASCWNKDPKLRLTAQNGWEQLQNFNISPPTEPSSLSPPPRPPKSSSLRREPPTKPKPKPKPKPKKPEGTYVSYYRKIEDGNVHFE